ncbi:MAG: hypothetical protein A3H64_01045 [Candidatus Ryanbacteria bacterium RIFCSPLOWO2_02_FULL_45_11c]|uniref:NYN domain-containing protein n=1 Tax=Candidatus Ryanbacteria bacterium RIFCSPLOWO2_02_FULL_45_11c TaxID=1802128 RepID=A0A1G2H1Y0_9BACT|nr:MAG: hypothetical protein A3H64_01045 [Candidatus Ryanbacteria bacterium RIFCSPLOWO2_02_FULL_45_11c]
MESRSKFKRFHLKGKTAVFIDWANVHGWGKSLKQEIDPVKLFAYLKEYKEILDIRFYFGTDKNQKSVEFLDGIKHIGYTLVTKPVKYILSAMVEDQRIYRRKCDFDMETCIDVHQLLNEYHSFIFFTGDGDYEPLYKLLISLHKQVIVVYTKGHLGREIWQLKKGIFKVELINIMGLQQNVPPVSRGA